MGGKKLHEVCVYAKCRIETGLSQPCLGSNLAPCWPETEAPVHQWQPVNVETSVYGIHACTFCCVSIITYPYTNTCKYITGDHSLAIYGHQGSSLSLKHGLCVLASLN